MIYTLNFTVYIILHLKIGKFPKYVWLTSVYKKKNYFININTPTIKWHILKVSGIWPYLAEYIFHIYFYVKI